MNKTWQEIFPWRGQTPWDVDVAVIGGGPAGLAATIRLRWLKTFPLVPVSVALVNSGPLGGLAKLGNSILTGPSLAFPAGQLVASLEDDLNKWPAPIVASRVISVHPENGCFLLQLENGRSLQALSVIVANGMLDIANLWQFWRRGVSATFGSRENLFQVLHQELSPSSQPLVLGGRQLLNMTEHIKNIQPRTRLVLLTPEEIVEAPHEKDGLEIVAGNAVLAKGDAIFEGLLLKQGGREITIAADTLVIDFNSLELEHAAAIEGLPRNEQGFLPADSRGCTQIDGLYGAGDCTGPPFAALVALGQGVQAAFSCYRYVFQRKYGEKPSLFAYYGDERVAAGPELPDFTLSSRLVPDRLVKNLPDRDTEAVWQLIDGARSITNIAEKLDAPLEQIFQTIKKLLQARAITFLPTTGD